MADPSLVADLAAADPSQWEAILQRSKPTTFSPYRQDTNWWLLRSALEAMVRAEPHPALMMSTGDLLAHDFPKTSPPRMVRLVVLSWSKSETVRYLSVVSLRLITSPTIGVGFWAVFMLACNR
jgi:hypothetical protein